MPIDQAGWTDFQSSKGFWMIQAGPYLQTVLCMLTSSGAAATIFSLSSKSLHNTRANTICSTFLTLPKTARSTLDVVSSGLALISSTMQLLQVCPVLLFCTSLTSKRRLVCTL